MAAEAGGVVGAEGVPGALSVVVFAGLLDGRPIGEDWKTEETCFKGLGDSSIVMLPASSRAPHLLHNISLECNEHMGV